MAVDCGALVAPISPLDVWRTIAEATARCARKTERRLGNRASSGLFVTDRPVRARGPTRKWDESSMTSAKNVLLFEIVPEESSIRSFLAYVRLLRRQSQARGLLPSRAPEAH